MCRVAMVAEGAAMDLVSLDRIQTRLNQMGESARATFDGIYQVDFTVAELEFSEEMKAQLAAGLVPLEAMQRQMTFRLTNKITFEASAFNSVRAGRPEMRNASNDSSHDVALPANCAMCHPLTYTPETGGIGRIRTGHGITCGNLYPWASHHGVVIFENHDALRWNREQLSDSFDCAQLWFEKVNARDPEAVFPVIGWNCGARSGASQAHGHMQVALGRGMHYAKIERLQRDALQYRSVTDRDYFDDLFSVHRAMQLGFERADGVRVLAHLTPIKERETILIAPNATHVTDALKNAIYDVLACYRDRLGVECFNLAVLQPPLRAPAGEGWDSFPVIVRLVDRGNPASATADWAVFEMYAISVVTQDPFRLATALAEAAGGGAASP
jgi:hypothetical protein